MNLLDQALEWRKLAQKASNPAVRQACLDCELKALQELLDRRLDHHNRKFAKG